LGACLPLIKRPYHSTLPYPETLIFAVKSI
jgi:hypothetical protein